MAKIIQFRRLKSKTTMENIASEDERLLRNYERLRDATKAVAIALADIKEHIVQEQVLDNIEHKT